MRNGLSNRLRTDGLNRLCRDLRISIPHCRVFGGIAEISFALPSRPGVFQILSVHLEAGLKIRLTWSFQATCVSKLGESIQEESLLSRNRCPVESFRCCECGIRLYGFTRKWRRPSVSTPQNVCCLSLKSTAGFDLRAFNHIICRGWNKKGRGAFPAFLRSDEQPLSPSFIARLLVYLTDVRSPCNFPLANRGCHSGAWRWR